MTLFHLQIILESIEWQYIIILWVVAMEATGGECQRGGFSGREREWDDSHTLTPHLWTPTSALRPAWLAIAISVETCHEDLSTGVSCENLAKPHDIGHQ